MAELMTMMRKVLAENLGLRHQVSVRASQIGNMQTGMTTQLGNMAVQVANPSLQVTRNNRANQTVTLQPAGAPKQASKAHFKPVLKLTI